MNNTDEETIQLLGKELIEIEAAISEAHAKRAILLEKLAEIIIPYKIETLTTSKAYPHIGKRCKIVIRKVILTTAKTLTWYVKAIPIRKDGQEARIGCYRWYKSDEEIKRSIPPVDIDLQEKILKSE